MSNARNLARLLPNVSGQLPETNLASTYSASKITGQLQDGNMAPGVIVQVVESVYSGTATYAGLTTWANGPMSATITPFSSSSKIMIFSTIIWDIGNETSCMFRFTRNGTAINTAADSYGATFGEGNNGNASWASQTTNMMLDSPATTSSLTYQLQILPYDSGRTCVF